MRQLVACADEVARASKEAAAFLRQWHGGVAFNLTDTFKAVRLLNSHDHRHDG
jgi:hypothetical protein